MSDCRDFTEMPECIANGDCSEEEKNNFYKHLEECDSCKEDLNFTLNIQNTLRSLPKIEVPDDFLASLNKKLDLEDKIKKEVPVVRRKNIFGIWKKYSALAACLLLAVLLKSNVWDLSSDMSKQDNLMFEIEKTVEISPKSVPIEVPAEVVLEVPKKDISIREPIEMPAEEPMEVPDEIFVESPENTEDIVEQQIVSELPAETEQKQEALVPQETKAEAKKKNSKVDAPINNKEGIKQIESKSEAVKKAEQESEQNIKPIDVSASEEVLFDESQKSGNKVLVMKATTPHSSVDIPAGPEDDVIMVDKVVPKKVKFDDYKMVESEELLEAFAISKVTDKTVIVATPAAMDAVSNLSFDTSNTSCEVPAVNHGAGSGSFFVSVDDQQTVASILRKYSLGENNETFMLSSKNYTSFINELQRQGIEYTDYMINTGKTNVAFKLMAA